MDRPRLRRAAALAPVLALASFGVATGATHKKPKPKPKIVHVIDDYYTCAGCSGSGTVKAKIKLKPGGSLKWTWGPDGSNQNTHDVNYKAPKKHKKGIKSFHSELAASDYTYSHTFKLAGSYKIFCSIHTSMKLLVVVKK